MGMLRHRTASGNDRSVAVDVRTIRRRSVPDLFTGRVDPESDQDAKPTAPFAIDQGSESLQRQSKSYTEASLTHLHHVARFRGFQRIR